MLKLFFPNWIVGVAKDTEKDKIGRLAATGELVHHHLDWWNSSIWIHHPPFIVIRQDKKIVAGLACPEYPPHVSWIRFFGAAKGRFANSAWTLMWSEVKKYLLDESVKFVHAIPIDTRFRALLENNGGMIINTVVNLSWDATRSTNREDLPWVNIRDMNGNELAQIADLDRACFEDIWQNTHDELVTAFRQAYFATVIEINGNLIGYQITTLSTSGCHLARLAVEPGYQGRGVGKMLLNHLISNLEMKGIRYLTVNTQEDNLRSLALYHKAGFSLTGSKFPVYRISVTGAPSS
jgi:[ribosomal protein S18]-alanine N-acetyltransferase